MKCSLRFVFGWLAIGMSVVSSFAYEGVWNGVLSYSVNEVAGEVTITDCDSSVSGELSITNSIDGYPVTAIGDAAFYWTQLTKVVIPDTVRAIGDRCFYYSSLQEMNIPDGVLSMGEKSFYECRGLTNITFSSSITNIGKDAFYRCSGLTSVILPESLTSIEGALFRDCSSITNIVIPNTVTNIGGWAFGYCSQLSDIDLPDHVTDIGMYAFWGCGKLASIVIPGTVESIEKETFKYCHQLANITLSEGVKQIGENAFYNCSKLENITIPASMTNLNSTAFTGCTSFDALIVAEGNPAYSDQEGVLFDKDFTTLVLLPFGYGQSYAIPSSVTDIAPSAFYGHSALTNIVFSGSVTNIGRSAFGSCSGLTDLSLPAGLEAIGDYAFKSCSGLERVTLPGNLVTIGNYAFKYCSKLAEITIPGSVKRIGGNAFERCTGLSEVTFSNGVESIGSYAFYYCSNLESITIPGSVSEIGSSAFINCTALKELGIHDGVGLINESAFSGCSSLESITIPGSVSSIGHSAFGSCTALTELVISDGVSLISEGAFGGCSQLEGVTIPPSVSSFGYGTTPFDGCSGLRYLLFQGNPPEFWFDSPTGVHSDFVFYYYAGADGFTTPVWMGYPCIELYHETFALSIFGGSGSGSYPAGFRVAVAADDPPLFTEWSVVPGVWSMNLLDEDAAYTTFIMPSNQVSISASYRTAYDGGSGTAIDPYRISTVQDLLEMQVLTNHYDKCFVLTADLDLAGHSFSRAVIAPFPLTGYTYEGDGFIGVFDGAGYVISNLCIVGNGTSHLGLFGKLSAGAEVRDLGLENFSVELDGWGRSIGGLCGENAGGLIADSYADGSVVVQYSMIQMVGGLCGVNGGIISNCYSMGIVDGRYVDFEAASYGGLCGFNNGSITRSYSTVDILGCLTGASWNGGLCGQNQGDISLSYSTGSVSGGGTGGLAGFCGSNSGSISNCYSTGSVAFSSTFYENGGFCGVNDGTIVDSFWDVQLAGTNTSAGGIGKTTVEMQTQSTFSNWDFSRIWTMDGYPIFRWQVASPASFNAWIVAQNVPADKQAFYACPAGDGVQNLLKYACGFSANTYISIPYEFITLPETSTNSAAFVVTYQKAKDVADASVFPVHSGALNGEWSAFGITLQKVGETAEQETWEARLPCTTNGFMRLKAELLP